MPKLFWKIFACKIPFFSNFFGKLLEKYCEEGIFYKVYTFTENGK